MSTGTDLIILRGGPHNEMKALILSNPYMSAKNCDIKMVSKPKIDSKDTGYYLDEMGATHFVYQTANLAVNCIWCGVKLKDKRIGIPLLMQRDCETLTVTTETPTFCCYEHCYSFLILHRNRAEYSNSISWLNEIYRREYPDSPPLTEGNDQLSYRCFGGFLDSETDPKRSFTRSPLINWRFIPIEYNKL